MTQTPVNSGADDTPRHWLYGFAARTVSFVMAVALSALILIYPKAIATSATEINHGMLSMLMWGIAAGFVHGVGFVPIHTLWRIVLGPIVGWVFMLAGGVFILASGPFA
jgi:cyd operon protein YbgE